MWRWSQMLHKTGSVAKPRLVINMDETSVRLLPASTAGCLVAEARRRLRSPCTLGMPATKRQTRGMLTQMVFVCNDATCQRALPTVLLISTRMLSKARWRAVRDDLPAHVHFWREKRGWVTGKLMTEALKLVAAALAPWRPSHEIIFVADTYRAHITDMVWRTLRTLGFAYLLIPAKLTWALQPCDTHVFAAYKRALSLLFQTRQAFAEDAPDYVARVVSVVVETYDSAVRAQSWAHAFASNGLTADLTAVSPRLLQQLAMPVPPSATQPLPELEDFACIFPRGARIPLDGIFAFAFSGAPNPAVLSHVPAVAPPQREAYFTRSSGATSSREFQPSVTSPVPRPTASTPAATTRRPPFPRARRLGPAPPRPA